MIKNKAVFSLSVFSSLGLLGLLFPSVGASLPGIEEHYGMTLSSSGMVSSLVQLGYALFCFSGGILSDLFEKRTVLIAGSIVYGASGILVAYSPIWQLTLVLFFIFGAGSGLIFIASNTLVIDLFRERKGTFLNIHHTFFALGSLSAPFIVSALVQRGFEWYSVFRIFGVLSLVIGAVIMLSDVKPVPLISAEKKREDSQSIKLKYLAVLKNKLFLKFLLVAMLGLGVQFGIIYLLISYLMKVSLISHKEASLIMSSFFFLLLAGRLLCSFLVSRHSAYKIVLTLLISLTITLAAGWILEGTPSKIMFALTGLASSGLMPTLLSLASSALDEKVRAASLGFLSMTGGLGGMLVTLLVSGLSAYIGLKSSFLVLIFVSLISAVIFLQITLQQNRSA
jgi:fucose permease